MDLNNNGEKNVQISLNISVLRKFIRLAILQFSSFKVSPGHYAQFFTRNKWLAYNRRSAIESIKRAISDKLLAGKSAL